MLDGFLEEARILERQEHHRNVVRVHQVFEAHGSAYVVMEYVDGLTLEEELSATSTGSLPESRVRAILDALTAGLAPVHAAGLLHRDIKPSNVRLRGDGSPVLLDFAPARRPRVAEDSDRPKLPSR